MAPANRCVFFSCKAGLMLTLLQPSFVVIVQLLSHVCLCDSTDCSTPGFPVLRYLPEFAQSHVHWVDDAIQPSHPLLPPSSPALSLFQHQGLFQLVGSASGGQVIEASASVPPMNIQGWSPLGWTGLISLLCKGLSRIFSSTTVQKHQFFSIQPAFYGPMKGAVTNCPWDWADQVRG